ncbi:MAG TPA: ATP-binding protein [Chitinophagales bacterium]|nr:ATP-binding protein [Chitinophagales bacterium]HNN27057.1 ATP-binding protein [Chitinophagales bacterium]
MPEQQNIEYKQSWHEDYLKWVCGFANAQGGVIFIGKDDDGNVVGVEDYKRLMDDIPNKIRNAMGITVEVNLQEENRKHFIEIVTVPYTVPISLRGRYYYRSGSTKQELTGSSLNEFLLKKSGKTWDDVIEPDTTFDDIDEKTVNAFLKEAQSSGRLPESKDLTITELFEKLRLTKNGQLKRAAIVLFGKDPGKYFPNIFVKIGRFGADDADLIFQETEEGNLLNLSQAVLDQLLRKFLIRKVSFEGLYRRETPEYPITALREVILNALVHRNYMGAPTQIRVYDDKITFWNDGRLSEELTLEDLKITHPSKPRNPIIADVCFKGNLIDAWGRGTIKIIDACINNQLPEPELTERNGGFLATIFGKTSERLRKDFGKTSERLRKNFGKEVIETLSLIIEHPEYSAEQLAEIIGKSSRSIENHIAKLKNAGVIIRKGGTYGGHWEINEQNKYE